jgi:hypothetical protein
VFGSAVGDHTKEQMDMSYKVGAEIAAKGFALVTGATFGIPHEAIKGAKSKGGMTIGISPAASRKDHIENYKMPMEDVVTIFSGLGFQGRNLINCRTCDACIFIKGSIGTLNEFTVAYKEEKVIGVLESCSGVSKLIREIVEKIDHNYSPTIIYSDDPIELVEKIEEELKRQNAKD